MTPLLVIVGVIVVATIGMHLGFDPVEFIMIVVGASVATYIMNIVPIQLSWWIISKLAGN